MNSPSQTPATIDNFAELNLPLISATKDPVTPARLKKCREIVDGLSSEIGRLHRLDVPAPSLLDGCQGRHWDTAPGEFVEVAEDVDPSTVPTLSIGQRMQGLWRSINFVNVQPLPQGTSDNQILTRAMSALKIASRFVDELAIDDQPGRLKDELSILEGAISTSLDEASFTPARTMAVVRTKTPWSEAQFALGLPGEKEANLWRRRSVDGSDALNELARRPAILYGGFEDYTIELESFSYLFDTQDSIRRMRATSTFQAATGYGKK